MSDSVMVALSRLGDPNVEDNQVDPLLRSVTKGFDRQRHEGILRTLLRTRDGIVSRRALFIFGELGYKAGDVIDDAIAHISHPAEYARSHLLEGLLYSRSSLTESQLAQILRMLEDSSSLIREKCIILTSTHDVETIEKAINQIPSGAALAAHQSAFQTAISLQGDIDAKFAMGADADELGGAYIFIDLLIEIRTGKEGSVPQCQGNDHLEQGVLAAMSRFRRLATRSN